MNTLDIPTILHIDDNDADLEFTQEAWHEYGPQASFIVDRDGEAGIKRIRAIIASFEQVPDLILLDLSLPKISGHEILKFIRSNELLRDTPVVILTGTPTAMERDRSLKLGATDHITKPVGMEETMAMIKRLRKLLEN
jgi:CheY-like chemotaxis protein